MKSKSIYYIYKEGNKVYSERRAIVYQNKKFTYIKRPGSEVLTYISTDAIHLTIDLSNIETGYYLSKPNNLNTSDLTLYESIRKSKEKIKGLNERKSRLQYDLSVVDHNLREEETNLLGLMNRLGNKNNLSGEW